MFFLKKSLSLLLWYCATGLTILFAALCWLVIWQDVWSPTMLGNRIFVLSLLIAFVCEGLRRKKGTNDALIYLLFPITGLTSGLAGWLLRYSLFGYLDLAVPLVIYLFFLIFLLSTHRKVGMYSSTMQVPALDPIIDAEVRRVAAQFTT